MEQNFAALRRFVRPQIEVERCDLCAAELAATHQHLIEPETRLVTCTCDACSIFFSGLGNTRYKRIPRNVRIPANFQITDAEWAAFMLPIQLAFFFRSSASDKMVALYPSPIGATESLLSLDAWNYLVAANPILNQIESDVEALLVNRIGENRDYFIAPIDRCFELVGILRTQWRGFSGGTDAWNAINSFFDELKVKARPISEAAHA